MKNKKILLGHSLFLSPNLQNYILDLYTIVK